MRSNLRPRGLRNKCQFRIFFQPWRTMLRPTSRLLSHKNSKQAGGKPSMSRPIPQKCMCHACVCRYGHLTVLLTPDDHPDLPCKDFSFVYCCFKQNLYKKRVPILQPLDCIKTKLSSHARVAARSRGRVEITRYYRFSTQYWHSFFFYIRVVVSFTKRPS